MKSNLLDDFSLNFQTDLIITPVCSSLKSSNRSCKHQKFTVKIPSVGNERSFFEPIKPMFQTRSNSLSKIRNRVHTSLTPNIVKISIEENILKRIDRSKSIRKVRVNHLKTHKEKYSFEILDKTLSRKLSNVMIPLPCTEIRALEQQRSMHRLRKLKRLPFRFDKENEFNF